MLRATVLLLALGCVSSIRFSIMAPNVFHIGVEERVSVTVFDAGQPVTVNLYLQDYPHRRKTFSEVQAVLQPQKASNTFLTVKVEPEDLPDTNSVDKQYVYLVAKSDDAHFKFSKEAKILLSYKDGMVFIQTDKPIYTPKQTVRIRVIPLEFDMKPSKRKITVVIMNPQGIRVEQWNDLDTSTGIISKELPLSDFIIKGNWTITALYGHQDVHNTSVKFEVREYVLPKFSVELSVPPYILNKTNKHIKVKVTARYTYGMPVVGAAKIRLNIEGANGSAILFANQDDILVRGVGTVDQKNDILRDIPEDFCFPKKCRLLVQADVIEKATGTKRSLVDKSCLFTSSPYIIEFKNTPKYFKPGMPFVVKVVITYPNKEPADSVPVTISATGVQKNVKKDLKPSGNSNSEDKTNEDGEVEFRVDSCSECKTITLKVETNNRELTKSQNAVAKYVVKAFDSGNRPMIMVRQLDVGKVGRNMKCESLPSGDGPKLAQLSYAVVSRGRILSHDTSNNNFDSITKTWSLRVSPEMSPSARLIVYYFENNEQVVADSILLKIEDSLPTQVEFPDAFKAQADGSKFQINEIERTPGVNYEFRIKAPQGTRLGLLGVDKSVYLLRNDNRLTRKRIFDTAENLDLGCGAGGGKDNKDVFKNAGVVLMTEKFESDGRNDYGCSDDASRKKRSLEVDLEKTCCDLGNDNVGKENENVTCIKLYMDSEKSLDDKCRMAMLKCCLEKSGIKDQTLRGRSLAGFDQDPKTDEESIAGSPVRKFFPEAWIWDEIIADSNGFATLPVTIPDTITTWIMQAVAINNQTGLGLATPLRIVSKKDTFVSLKMPYSVKRGEQVSLLATVFNYAQEDVQAKIFIKGGDDFCSSAEMGQLELLGIVTVPPDNAKSVTVPIIPKITGEIEVEVGSVFQIAFANSWMNVGADSVKRKLLVVPEGVEHKISRSFVLDPKGTLDDDKNKPTQGPSKIAGQFDSIDMKLPENSKVVPGSIGVVVYLTGNLLGPVVNTTIEGGLEKFFRQPTGCGEQTMIYLAPNVYVLEYLMNTKQLSGANEENAYRFIKSGYQRELNYRRNDKSFSAFGENRPGSTWLTAFVMRVFCKARQFPGVNIDENLVCDSVNWLIQNQRDDGALPEVHAVIHGEMVGGVYTEGDVAMTAFVLSALAECKCTGVNSQQSILRAKDYLEKQYKNLNRPYSMALTAYALALVESKEKFNTNDRLVQRAIYDSAKKSRHWSTGSNALDVETAGYALLTQVMLGRTEYAGPIVTYLTNQRKGGVGFDSTQDTVVALQALALYSEKTAGNALDLRVKLTSEVDSDWKPPEIHITPENALLRREIKEVRKIPVDKFLNGKLFVESKGSGVGVLEVEIRYNVPSSRGEICKFVLDTTVKETEDPSAKPIVLMEDEPDNEKPQEKPKQGRKKGRGCKKLKGEAKRRCKNKGRKDKGNKKPQKYQPVKSIDLKVCTRYKEQGGTGMAIMDIGILTGFKLDEDSERKLKQNGTLPELDKLEVSDRSLVIYLSEIPSDRDLCVNVTFEREYDVGAVQAVPVNVYDYYKPDQSCSVFYGPPKFSPLKLGACDIGFSSCKCSQDKCPDKDPSIDNTQKLSKMACRKYHYVIKGKVMTVDEDESMLAYKVEVVKIIQTPSKELKIKKVSLLNKVVDAIDLVKGAACKSADLKMNEEYLFMGLDKGQRYYLDQTSFVKLWPTDRNDSDKKKLDKFAKEHKCQ